jgi:hypothetical protein
MVTSNEPARRSPSLGTRRAWADKGGGKTDKTDPEARPVPQVRHGSYRAEKTVSDPLMLSAWRLAKELVPESLRFNTGGSSAEGAPLRLIVTNPDTNTWADCWVKAECSTDEIRVELQRLVDQMR